MFVLTYRTPDGYLRVQPTDHIWSYARNANAEARMVAKHHGLSIKVVDYSDVVADAVAKAALAKAAYDEIDTGEHQCYYTETPDGFGCPTCYYF